MKAISSPKSDFSSVSRGDSVYNPVKVSGLISDKYVLEILTYTHKKARSIQNISATFGIPIAVCYRKVHQLEKLGFLRCIGKKLNGKGKWEKHYQSQVVNAHFFLEKGKFRARVQLSTGTVDDFGGSWSPIDVATK